MRKLVVCSLLTFLIVFAGCGGGPKPISVSLSPNQSPTVMAGGTVSITATVSNDPKAAGVTWSLSGPGALSGQTSTSVTYTAPSPISATTTASVKATSVTDSTKVFTLTINLQAVLVSLAPSSPQTVDQGQVVNVTATITGDPQTKGVTWSLTGAGSLSGQTATTVTYTAPASVTATSSPVITGTSAFDNTKTGTLTINLVPPPTVTNTSPLAAGQVGVAYSASLTATNGVTPYTWTITSGTLPANLTLSGSTISGMPTTAGTSTFTVQVKDASGLTNTKGLSITINQPPTITSASSTTFTAGVAGTFSVTTTGFPTPALSETGSLPAGVTFVDNGNGTATLSGTTSTTGNFPITITANNGISPNGTQKFTLTVAQAPTITSANNTTFTVGSAGTFTVTTSGFPAPSLAESGSLPSGVTFTDNGNGTATLAGTPAANTGKIYSISITAQNSAGNAPPQSFTLTVDQAPAITSANSTTFTVLAAGSFTVTTTGFPTPALSETGALPSGVTFVDKGNGTATLSGTPASGTAGTYPITITANNGVSPNFPQSFTLTVDTAPVITSAASTTFTVGVPGTFTVTTIGTPTPSLTESGTLPSGVTFTDNGNGTATLAGTPAAGTGNTYSITIKAHNGIGTDATQPFSLTVDQAPQITSPNSTTFTVGQQGLLQVTTTGFPTPALSENGALPSGVTFTDNGNGTANLSGAAAPGSNGTYPFTITANNSVLPNGTQNFTLTVNPPAQLVVSPTTGALPNGTQSTSYSTTISATGGVQPYTFSLDSTSAALPAGLALTQSNPGQSNNTGVISGTPTTTGTTTGIIVDVTDSNVPATTIKATYSLTISMSSCGSGQESMLDGQYAFVLKGFDSSGNPAVVGGVLTFNGTTNNGLITGGTIDMNLNSGVQTNLGLTSGSYSVGPDQRGCMVVTTSAGTQNYRFSVGNLNSGVASTGHVVDFDTTGPFVVGTMRKQTTSAFGTGSGQITGNYAFGVSSANNTANGGGKFGAVGLFNFSTGNITGGEIDMNEYGTLDGSSSNTKWPTSPISINSGTTYSVSSTTGRGTFSFTPNGLATMDGILYVVSSTDVLALSSDTQTSNNLWAGELMQQSGTPFAANPLSGTYIGYDSGLGSSSGRTDITLLGPMTSGSSTLTGTDLRDDSGTFSSQTLSGSYSVASTGRMTLSGGSGKNSPVLYLVNTSEAFLLNSNSGVDVGFFQSQSGSPFSDSSVSGTYAYGVIDPEIAGDSVKSGVVAFANPNATLTEDDNSDGTLTVDSTKSSTYSVDSTGLGTIPPSGSSSCTWSASSTTCQSLFYIISPTKAVVMDATSSDPKITIADQ